MTTTRRDFLAAAVTAAGATAVPDHAHAADHIHQDVPADVELRVKSLESLLVEKGLVDRAALDALVDVHENRVGPRNGARVVARAWIDPGYKTRLLASGTTAIEVRVWDSTAEQRYLVLPERPTGTERLGEDALAALVTRDSMIGVAKIMPQQSGRPA
jgi:hypothetical protein